MTQEKLVPSIHKYMNHYFRLWRAQGAQVSSGLCCSALTHCGVTNLNCGLNYGLLLSNDLSLLREEEGEMPYFISSLLLLFGLMAERSDRWRRRRGNIRKMPTILKAAPDVQCHPRQKEAKLKKSSEGGGGGGGEERKAN